MSRALSHYYSRLSSVSYVPSVSSISSITLYNNAHSITKGMGILLLLTCCTDSALATYYSNTHDFTWILVLSFFAGFAASYGIGANDVANSFATSVGAKSLSISQAVGVASICEFTGAVLMGSQVTKTMRSGIADASCFEDNPGLLMWGMFCVLCLTGFWLVFASVYEMPVSTTHSTVGGIIGMTMMARGTDCVIWSEPTDEFPYVKGVSAIVISWILSPICSGILSAIIYGITYITVLRDKTHSFERTKYLFPFIFGFTAAINAGMFIVKGSKGKQDEFGTTSIIENAKNGDGSQLALILSIVFCSASGITFICMPLLLKKVKEHVNIMDQLRILFGYSREASTDYFSTKPVIDISDMKDGETFDISSTEKPVNDSLSQSVPEPTIAYTPYTYLTSFLQYITTEMYADPYDVIQDNQYTIDMHDNCTRHDTDTEEMFKFVQVFSAIIGSLSHGANDIANAMGPFAAIYTIWKLNEVPSNNDEIGDNMYWILSYGGAGIIVGLATYGYKIISAMGVKLITVTPSRGYAIELGAAFMVMFGSVQGWPLSTTHCQVGATVGVGLFEGRNGVNPWILGKAIIGWFATLLVCGMGAALLTGPNPEYLISDESSSVT